MLPTAAQIMETHLISVSPDAPLLDVHRLFVEEEISGAPVVDDQGNLVGVISSSDLLRAVEEEHDTAVVETDYFRSELPYSGPDWTTAPEDFQDRLRERRAAEVMTAEVITVPSDTPMPQVARVLRESHIHRVFVIEDGALQGIISLSDMLKIIEDLKEL